MNKKSARPAAGTAGRTDGGGAGLCNAWPGPQGHSITPGHARQARPFVAGVLGHGAAAALTAQELATLLGLSDTRPVTLAIQAERAAGVPICAMVSGPERGYFLADSPDELEVYMKSLRHRVRAVQQTQRALENTLLNMTGQQVLEGWTVD